MPLAVLTALLFAVGLYFAFFNSPADYQMGDTVRIMYVHVPNAWLSQFVYGVMAVAALGTLVWRHPLADVAQQGGGAARRDLHRARALHRLALGPPDLGHVLGMGRAHDLDARPAASSISASSRCGAPSTTSCAPARIVAIVTLVGAVNIPIIKFSVDWWNTLHQPASVFTASAARSMPGSILTPLLRDDPRLHAAVPRRCTSSRMRTEILRRRAETLSRQAARQGRAMIDLGPHAVFIVWAYAGVAVLSPALIAWVVAGTRGGSRRGSPRSRRRASAAARPATGRLTPHPAASSCRSSLLVGLVAVFAMNIDRDPGLVRSVLIDKPAPAFALPAVDGLGVPGFDTAALKGEVTVVNVFASWCIPCRDEHPLLEALKAADRRPARSASTRRTRRRTRAAFLAELGNPYDAIGADANGRVSIDWGVYGVPETFVVDADGHHHASSMSARSWPKRSSGGDPGDREGSVGQLSGTGGTSRR